MSTVAEYEVPQISSSFSMFGENYQPKLSVVVAQKCISTRSLAEDPKDLITHLPAQSLTTPLHRRNGMTSS